ncbi:CHAT domain-containing protein [Algoriphagus confluentis]|uniref:CHAT domain-containing protein n=1 Tax=Algoriphagus confluentis TaxID=1697556 RepID=UPI0030C6A925
MDSRLEKMEEKVSKNDFVEIFPMMEELLHKISIGELRPSPRQSLRFGVVRMAVLDYLGESEKGLALGDSLEKDKALEVIPGSEWASFQYRKSTILLNQEKFLESAQTYEKAIRLFEMQPQPDFSQVALCYNNLGYLQDILGFQNRSMENYYRAFEIWKISHLDDFENISTVLNNLIFAEIEYGNYSAASELLHFFERYVAETQSTYDLTQVEALDLEIKLLLNYSRYYGATKNDRLLDLNLTKAEKLLKTSPKDFFAEQWGVLAVMYEEAGFLQKELKNYSAAVAYYERMRNLPLSGFFEMKYHANLAIVYYDAGENEKSLAFTRKSLSLLNQFGFEGSSSFSLQVLQADLLYRMGREEASILGLQKMLGELLDREISRSSIPQLSYRDFSRLNNVRYLTILIKAGQIFRKVGLKNNNRSDLRCSYALFLIAAEMFQEYYLKGSYTQSLENIHRQIQEGLLFMALEKGLLKKEEKILVVELLEKNGSQQGWKKFLSKNEEFLGTTADFLRELNLKSLELNQVNASSDQEKGLRDELRQIERRIEEEDTYRFFTGGSFTLVEFQKKLSPQTTVLSYAVTENQVFVTLIQRGHLEIFSLGPVAPVSSWTEEFQNSLRRLDDSYKEAATVLFRLLIGPLSKQLTDEVFILPDDFLHVLPFEALLDDKRKFLLENHRVSYQQSFRQMSFQRLKSRPLGDGFLVAFAPEYQGTGYQAIQNNLTEVSQLVQALDGHLYIGQHATKMSFVNSFTDYQVHHLAMHSAQDPVNFEESALIFSGGEKLRLGDLYQMNFPAELVVLSACNTGLGQLMPGEGLMSLSKALSFAGVKSTVYSLWEVPDRETADLMVDFYREIQEGKPKNTALTLAKRRFLAENPLKKHPFFWAGFVLNGKSEPLEKPYFRGGYWWSLGLVLVIVGALFYSLKIRKRK